jgi:HCOMODA/2-hydroxy-3-carboxy-muconic semialdehyde decarboxylase
MSAATAALKAAQRDALRDATRDLVVANRILAHEGILDAFGHVSVRHPADPSRFLLSRMVAPGQVAAADILEFNLDSQPIKKDGPKVFVERFIHGEIYRRRPDVMAVVHSHSPALIPFGTNSTKLKPMYHMSAFLGQGAPVFDIRDCDKKSDMLVRNGLHGSALARSLGEAAVALMRGHGNVSTGPNVRVAVYRAVYCELNAQLQLQAHMLGGKTRFLSPSEASGADKANIAVLDKAWNYWVERAGCAHYYAIKTKTTNRRKP